MRNETTGHLDERLCQRRKELLTKLKINSFDGVTKQDWTKFFQVNQVTSFSFKSKSEIEWENSFFNYYIDTLPHTVEEIEVRVCSADDNQFLLLQEYLEKLPRISKLYFANRAGPFLPRIATILAKHIDSLTELSLHRTEADRLNNQNSEMLSAISDCINLTTLELHDFIIRDEYSCEQIVKNCQSIRLLDLNLCEISEPCLRSLMSLPNLEDLTINTINTTLTKEAKKLKNLDLFNCTDWDSLARALVFMPLLTLDGYGDPITETAARIMKETIYSRRQNIVLYSINSDGPYTLRVTEITRNAPGPKNWFSIIIDEKDFEKIQILTQV